MSTASKNSNLDFDLDLNIDNYSFADVLNLFQLNPGHAGIAITDRDLRRCRETVDKLHPSHHSNLGIEYYNFFNRAYEVLESKSVKSSKPIGKMGAMREPAYAPYTGDGSRDYPQGDEEYGERTGGGGAGGGHMPYGFYSVAQSNPHREARIAAREAGAAAAAQTTAAAAAARIASVPPSSSLLGYYTPQAFSTRMVTIHTDDRDVLKYPFENAFEVVLPAVIKHAISVELFDISLPTVYYNVSTHFQNTKMWVSVPLYFIAPIEVEVPSGRYTPDQLCAELTLQLNGAMSAKLYAVGAFSSPSTQYTKFSVTYSGVTRKVSFLNTEDEYVLHFDSRSEYAQDDPGVPRFESWKLLKHWGLGYILGFYKLAYAVTRANGGSTLAVTSPAMADVEVPTTIYMDLDPFNWIDEVSPFSIATTDSYNGDFNGRVNNSFAKLVLSTTTTATTTGSNANGYGYVPVKKFKRVLPQTVEKVGRLKIKFRYHTGMLVDFQQQGFDFSLKFECRFV
jgi:hypothetical protein